MSVSDHFVVTRSSLRDHLFSMVRTWETSDICIQLDWIPNKSTVQHSDENDGSGCYKIQSVSRSLQMQKSGSHPPFILYEDCLTMWADFRECHPKGLRFDSWMGHLGCGHYVVKSCTLSCFHSCLRLKINLHNHSNAEIWLSPSLYSIKKDVMNKKVVL